MSNINDVGAFHEKFGLPRVGRYCSLCDQTHDFDPAVQPGPREVPDELLDFRGKFLDEELAEFYKGMADEDIAQMADALVDLVYVAMGTAHLLGLPWEELWDDVQRANMAKVRAASDGSDSKRGSAWDVVKPEGWVPPDTWRVLERHGWSRPDTSGYVEVSEVDLGGLDAYPDEQPGQGPY